MLVIGLYDGFVEPTPEREHAELVARFRNEMWGDLLSDKARKTEIGLVEVEGCDRYASKSF